MKLGVCYYPEHWPRARWEQDAEMMSAAGLKLVRIGEFAWHQMEPEPGDYRWEWLDEAIAILGAAGLEVILGTPTATPPIWLSRQHPDILAVTAGGQRRDHGGRRHTCPTSPTYRRYSRQIVRALAHRYRNNPYLVGWQTDNEFGGGNSARCYCEQCATAFRRWLWEKYETVQALNEAWGNSFWSQNYNHFEEIEPPGERIGKKNPSHLLDYFRFASDTFVAFQQEQIEILRQETPELSVTHNFMGLFPDLDQYALAEPLDFASWDAYPTGHPDRLREIVYPPGRDSSRNDPAYAYDVGEAMINNLGHDLTWGLKQQPFWVMEQQAGYINWADVNPGVRPGTPRLWTWQALAAGAEAVLYFRWRATRFAFEQYHSGLLRHDGAPDVGYRDVVRLQAEQALMARIAAEPARAPVALFNNYEDLWALQEQPHRHDFHYQRLLFLYYEALQRLGLPVNVISPRDSLEGYRLLLAPTLPLVDEALAAHLEEAVRGGATLLLGVRSGSKTASNLFTGETLPGRLRPLVGATVEQWQSLPDGVRLGLESDLPGLAGSAGYWTETLHPAGVETEAPVRYADSPFAVAGAVTAALTRHPLGAGRVYYLGWYPDEAQTRALLLHLAGEAGVERAATHLPPGLLARRRGPFTILLNFSERALTATLGGEEVPVPARDVVVREIGE